MTRIIFVGLHNKPSMKPLDVKTKSGKLIERVVEKCRYHGMNVLKTNLYDSNYLPRDDDRANMRFEWIERVELFKDDIVVLLGQMVHNEFPEIPQIRVIKVAHPASKKSHVDMDEYVQKTFDLIKKVSSDSVAV